MNPKDKYKLKFEIKIYGSGENVYTMKQINV